MKQLLTKTLSFKRSQQALLLALIGLVLITGMAQAQTTPSRTITDDEVNEVAGELFCPTCLNTPLDVCPTQTCRDWRELIRQQLAAGRSKEEIKSYFAATYGDHVLAEPPSTGFDIIVWALPILAVLLGAMGFAGILRRLRQSTVATAEENAGTIAPAGPSTDDEYLALVEQELRKSS